MRRAQKKKSRAFSHSNSRGKLITNVQQMNLKMENPGALTQLISKEKSGMENGQNVIKDVQESEAY